MTFTARDRVLAMLIPALVIFGILAWLCAGKFNELERTRSALAKTQAELARFVSPPPSADELKLAAVTAKIAGVDKQIQEVQIRIAELTTKIAAKDSQIDTWHAAWRKATAFTRSTQARNDRIRKLNGILLRHGLAFVEDSDTKAGTLSPVVDSLAKRIAQGPDAEQPRLRTVRCVGGFLDMHRAIREIGTGEALALPVSLTMKTTEDPQRHEWTLFFWI